MEQKIIDALLLRCYMTHYTWARQRAIYEKLFDEAMTQQFFYCLYRDELYEIEDKMTKQEYEDYSRTVYCRN